MWDQLRPLRLIAAAGLAGSLAAPALVSAPASGAPLAQTGATRAASTAAAAHVHDVTARAGRAGAHLGSIYVSAYLTTENRNAARDSRVYVQQLRKGTWRSVGSRVIADPYGPGMKLTWASSKAATLRVVVPKLDLVTARMKVPAAPTSPRSRYYVRHDRSDDGGTILRVFKDGTTYAVYYGGLEYSCWAGRLANDRLRLKTFDFGTGKLSYRTAGTWRTLRIADPATRPVGGARTSLSGTNKRYLGFCSQPAFAATSTHPHGL